MRLIKEKDINIEIDSLYTEYSSQLYYYALGYVQDTQVAKDVLQEVFIKLWENYSSVKDLNAFLYSTCKNLCLNHLRSQERLKQREEFFVESLDDSDKDEVLRLAEKVNDVIKKLPEKCRKIFILSTLEGLKYADIAEDLGVSVNTVKTQMKVAYKKIRESLPLNPWELSVILHFFLKNL